MEVVRCYSPGDFILDVGGGNGFVSLFLQNSGFEVILLEPGQQGIVNAKQRGFKNIICSTLEDAHILPNVIPSVGLFDILEHVKDDLKFSRQLFAVIRPGGLLYVTVPAYQFLWSYEDKLAGHHRRYTLKSLNKILVDSGFQIEFMTYFFSFLPLPIFFLRTMPSKFGIVRNIDDLDRSKQEHATQTGMIGTLLDAIWSWELKKLRKKQMIKFGGSCLAIARKPI